MADEHGMWTKLFQDYLLLKRMKLLHEYYKYLELCFKPGRITKHIHNLNIK